MAVNLFGCAEPKVRPDPVAILQIKPDCSIVEQQLAFLRGMIPTREEHKEAEMQMIFADRNTFEANKKVREYTYDRVIRSKINDIYYVCATRQ